MFVHTEQYFIAYNRKLGFSSNEPISMFKKVSLEITFKVF